MALMPRAAAADLKVPFFYDKKERSKEENL
jgi:hypothetical protein